MLAVRLESHHSRTVNHETATHVKILAMISMYQS